MTAAKNPPLPPMVKAYLAAIGKAGGRSKSPLKLAAIRANLAKGRLAKLRKSRARELSSTKRISHLTKPL